MAAVRTLPGWVTLGDLVGDVEHIGSTSMPGMPAKPIIDMMAAVADLVAHQGPARVAHHGFKAMQISASALTAEALKLTMPASALAPLASTAREIELRPCTSATECIMVMSAGPT